MHPTPCGHLDEREPACTIGRRFPRECVHCAAYEPGLNLQERQRCEAWAHARMLAVVTHNPESGP